MHELRAHKGMGPQRGQAQETEQPKQRRRKPQMMEVRYCPHCGTDMLAVSVALTVATKR